MIWAAPHPLCPTSKGPHFIPPLSVPLRVPGRIPYTRLHTHKIFRPRVDPSPPHKIFSRGGDGGCGRVLVVGNKVPRPLPHPIHTHITHALPTPIHACMKGSRPKVTGRLGKRGCGCASVWWGPYAYRNHRRWARVEAVFIRK